MPKASENLTWCANHAAEELREKFYLGSSPHMVTEAIKEAFILGVAHGGMDHDLFEASLKWTKENEKTNEKETSNA